MAACREIPYGIQQPAVSAQVARLEEDLGGRLFERRPFRLTEPGKVLYDFIAPFFGRLGEVEEELRGRVVRRLRLAGLTEVMRRHVPALLVKLRERYPGLKVTLQEIEQRGAERLIAQGEADMAITVLESKLPPGFRSVTLARLPLCLLVKAGSPFRRSAEVIAAGAAGRIPLVSLPPHELLPRMFQKELARRKRVWRTEIEASSHDLVTIYVGTGLGAGLSVWTPDLAANPTVRVLPLAGFPALPIGAFWRGRLGGIGQAFLDDVVARSKGIAPGRK